MFLTFTPEELEELRRFDAEVDAAPMTYEDYQISDFVEQLLFPERWLERARRREYKRRTYERDGEKRRQYQREYRAAHKEEAAARPTGSGYLPSRGTIGGGKRRPGKRSGRPAGLPPPNGNGPMIGNISAGGGKRRRKERGLEGPRFFLQRVTM